ADVVLHRTLWILIKMHMIVDQFFISTFIELGSVLFKFLIILFSFDMFLCLIEQSNCATHFLHNGTFILLYHQADNSETQSYVIFHMFLMHIAIFDVMIPVRLFNHALPYNLICYARYIYPEVPNSDLASRVFWQYSFNASLVSVTVHLLHPILDNMTR
ncbi:hypothetical protein ACJX0J_030919, partial [Zea mays]